MHSLKYLLEKEFLQIRRNPFMARVIILVPIIQMLVLVPAVTFDIRHIDLCIVDQDLSPASRRLTGKLEGSSFFRIRRETFTLREAQNEMLENRADAILNVPANFGRDLIRTGTGDVQLLIDGINGSLAQTSMAYLSGVIQDFNRNIVFENIGIQPVSPAPQIQIRKRFWFNPELDYKIYMAPGILAILVTSIGFLLSGLNLVREKEMGTSEQINVTPVRKYEFILGKMIPFMVIGIADLSFGLLLARLVYSMPFEGNIFILFLFVLIYLVAVMGLGLFLSTFAATQQQYLFIAFFFMMIFILMSGIFTPADSMPVWAQQVNRLNPASYFIRVIRLIVLKGAGLHQIGWDMLSLGLLALGTTALASVKYRKTA